MSTLTRSLETGTSQRCIGPQLLLQDQSLNDVRMLQEFEGSRNLLFGVILLPQQPTPTTIWLLVPVSFSYIAKRHVRACGWDTSTPLSCSEFTAEKVTLLQPQRLSRSRRRQVRPRSRTPSSVTSPAWAISRTLNEGHLRASTARL